MRVAIDTVKNKKSGTYKTYLFIILIIITLHTTNNCTVCYQFSQKRNKKSISIGKYSYN